MGRFRIQSKHKDQALEYFESLGGDYELQVSRGPLRWLRRREREDVCDLLFDSETQRLAGKTFLDVGCGSGFYSLRAKRLGMHVTSMDAIPEMVQRLSSKVDAVQVDDVESSDLSETFDRVVCAGVLDFVVNPERAFANLARWTAPGGRLVLLLPHSGWGGTIYRFEKTLLGIRVNLFSESWVSERAGLHGLSILTVRAPLPTNRAYLLERPLT